MTKNIYRIDFKIFLGKSLGVIEGNLGISEIGDGCSIIFRKYGHY
jgi:hypothetical protein